MSLNLSTIGRNTAGKSTTDLMNNGSAVANAHIEIRTGEKPATPQMTATGALLSTLQLSNPAFGNWANGQSPSNTISPDINIIASGKARWFRLYNRDGDAICDGDITTTGGGGDIEFDNVNFVAGGAVTLTSLIAIVPQS